jgi:hypothetical protein
MALQIRRGPTADRLLVQFAEGELIYDTDLGAVFVGDGTTLGGTPVTEFTNNDAVVAVKDSLLLGNEVNQNIAFSYNQQTGAITAAVTLDGIGITALVDDTTPQLGGDLDVNSNDITGTGNINITGTVTATSFSGVTATMVGLGNVTNESKATMFTSPTFTGTVSGVSATHVGLGNVTNESKTTMFTSPAFTGTATAENLTISGQASVNSGVSQPLTVNIDDSASITATRAVAMLLNVDAPTALLSFSGPSLESIVTDAGTQAETKLSLVNSVTTPDGPAWRVYLHDGATYENRLKIEALASGVVLNNQLIIQKNGFFTHTGITPTISDTVNLTLYPEGNVVTYGNIVPGIQGDDGNGNPVTLSSGSFDIGSDNTRYRNLYLENGLVTTPPATSAGKAGDVIGSVAFDGTYVYYCTATYTDGLSAIWERAALTYATW